ncbi:MAG: LamG domain-containing protein [Verrucomicrobiota bacterium]
MTAFTNPRNLALALLLPLSTAGQAGVEADLLVGYTTGARDARGGDAQVIAEIRQGILNTNLAHDKSLTDATVNERMIALFSISETGRDIGGMLGEWRRQRGGNSFGQSQAYWESFLGIDLSMIVSNAATGGSNGQAETPGVYSSVRVNRLNQPTFPHELGHSYSAIHEQGHTFNSSGGSSRTTLLDSRGRNYGTIVNNYSNPSVTEQGGTTGTASDNNALRIFNQRLVRQNVRAANNNPSPSDPNIDVDPDQTEFDYDLGLLSSPVQTGGWLPITPETGGDVSWSTIVTGVDRGTNPGVNDINRDFITHTAPATLSHALGQGLWRVTITTGDVDEARDFVRISAEGGAVVRDNINNNPSQFFNTVFDVPVTDGTLDLEFSDTGGNGNGWAVTRLSLDKVTDPNIDEDNDNLSDVWEYEFFASLTVTAGGPTEDFDNDGLTDREECEAFSDPTQADGDADGLSDFDEVRIHASNPLNPDSDGDSFYDNEEVLQSTSPINAAARPRIPGLVAYYRFDEGEGGTAADTAGDDNPEDATANGNIGWNDAFQLIGPASLELDGNAFLTVPTPFADDTTELTFSVWVNPDTDGGYKGVYAGRGDGATSSLGNWGVNVENGHADFRFASPGGSSTGVDTADNSVIAAGGWYHLAMTWTTNGSTGTGKIYRNGSLITTTSSGISSNFVQPELGYFIGNDPVIAGRIFDGRIDDLAVFDRALSDTEISEISTKGFQGLGIAAALLPVAPVTDSDGDSLSDSDELNLYGTDPLLRDSDSDGHSDGDEIAQRSDPNSASSLPLISGMVAYYPFDEGSGTTAFDETPGGMSLDAQQDQGQIGWSSISQKIGSACLDLDGSSYLTVGSAIPANAITVTFSAWVNPDEDGGYKGIYAGRGEASTSGLGNWGLNIEGGHADFRYANNSGSSLGVDSADDSILATDGWYHLAMTWDSSGPSPVGKVFLNGVEVATAPASISPTFIQPARGFFIGTDPVADDRRFDGKIDDLAVFTRILSNSEIAAIHSTGQMGGGILSAVAPPPAAVPANFEFAFTPGTNGEDVSLSWDSTEHAIYDVLGSLDLESWDILAEGIVGTGGTLDFEDLDGGTLPRKFYSIRQR